MNTGGNRTDWEYPTIGTHPARVVGFYDIGTQETQNPDSGANEDKHQVIFIYGLLGPERTKDGQPFTSLEFVTVSLHSKATLAKRLNTLGAKLVQGKPDKFGGFFYTIDPKFQFSELVNKPCFIEIINKPKGEGTKVGGVSAPVAGFEVPVWSGELPATTYLDFESKTFNADLEGCPKFIQKKVQFSKEFGAPLENQTAGPAEGPAVNHPKFEDDSLDPPF